MDLLAKRAASEACENAKSAPGAAPTAPMTPAPAMKAPGPSESLPGFLGRCRSHRAGVCSSRHDFAFAEISEAVRLPSY